MPRQNRVQPWLRDPRSRFIAESKLSWNAITRGRRPTVQMVESVLAAHPDRENFYIQVSGDALKTLRDSFIRAALYTQRSSALKALVQQGTVSI